MSDSTPDDPQGWPFSGGFDLNELLRMLHSSGPVNWEVAQQVATGLAAIDPESGEPRPDPPVGAARAESLVAVVRAAQTHVVAATGLAEAAAVPVRGLTRAEWTGVTLEGLRPVLEALAATITRPLGAGGGPGPIDADEADEADESELLAAMMRALAPMLFGLQAGALAGLLAQHALGQFDLQLPLTGAPQLAFVPANLDAFARDWSLPLDDLTFALALRDVVHAAQQSVTWVRERLVRLCTDYVAGYTLSPEALAERLPWIEQLEQLDFDPLEALRRGELPDLAELANLANLPEGAAFDLDPEVLLAGMRTAEQEPVRAELQRFAAVLAGYADAVVDTLGTHLVPDVARHDEALRRHRVTRGKAAELVDSMLGLQVDRDQYERGLAFCQGVIERAELPALNRLWEREAHVPTEAELDAPGLWLARIELDLP